MPHASPSATFGLRKLHSLSGIAPLGLFLLTHLYALSHAPMGALAFDGFLEGVKRLPLLPAAELLLVLYPLLLHGLLGLFLTYQSRPNSFRLATLAYLTYLLHRITGVMAFVFICWHLWMFRLAELFYGVDITFDRLAREFGNDGVFVLHLLGLGAVVFHFSRGLWQSGQSWGITIGRQSRRTWGYLCAGLGIICFGIGLAASLSLRGVALGVALP